MAVESEEGDIDLLNDETFGDGAVVDDWEASHFSKTIGESHGSPLPIHHDDVIIKAMPAVQRNPVPGSEQEELLPQLNQLKIKELWPSSPKQASPHDSIWSSPELPVRPKDTRKQTNTSPSLPPGSKAVTLEELEREYLTPSPSTNSTSQPHSSPQPSNHTPQSGVAPSVGIGLAAAPTAPYPLVGGPLPPPMPIGQMPPIGVHRPHPTMGWRMPPHGRFPVHPGYPPPRIPLPNVPIRPQQGHMPHPHYPRGPPHPSRPQHPFPHHPHHRHPPQRHPHPHHHMQDWSWEAQETPRKTRRSEYLGEMKADGSGFMTQKEKEWVIRIQLLQLQSPDPSNDDYYYQNFMKRKLILEEQKRHQLQSHDISHDNSGLSPAHSSSPSSDSNESSTQTPLLTLPQVERKEWNYRPIEFQGTLGKVTPSTISAPRKTIDVPLSGGGSGGGEGAKDTYTKKKQTLAVIEKLYLLVLELEDMEQKARSLPDEYRVELASKRDMMRSEMFSLLKLKMLGEPWSKSDDSTLLLMMSYRKGKRVMKRVLPKLSDDHAHAALAVLIRNLSTIMKKDSSDQAMPELIPSVLAIVAGLNLPLVNLSLSSLVSSTSSSSLAFIRVVQGEFGASLVLGLIRRGQKLAESMEDLPNQVHEEWITVTKDLAIELHPHQAILKQSSSKSVVALVDVMASLTHLQH